MKSEDMRNCNILLAETYDYGYADGKQDAIDAMRKRFEKEMNNPYFNAKFEKELKIYQFYLHL